MLLQNIYRLNLFMSWLIKFNDNLTINYPMAEFQSYTSTHLLLSEWQKPIHRHSLLFVACAIYTTPFSLSYSLSHFNMSSADPDETWDTVSTFWLIQCDSLWSADSNCLSHCSIKDRSPYWGKHTWPKAFIIFSDIIAHVRHRHES